MGNGVVCRWSNHRPTQVVLFCRDILRASSEKSQYVFARWHLICPKKDEHFKTPNDKELLLGTAGIRKHASESNLDVPVMLCAYSSRECADFGLKSNEAIGDVEIDWKGVWIGRSYWLTDLKLISVTEPTEIDILISASSKIH